MCSALETHNILHHDRNVTAFRPTISVCNSTETDNIRAQERNDECAHAEGNAIIAQRVQGVGAQQEQGALLARVVVVDANRWVHLGRFVAGKRNCPT